MSLSAAIVDPKLFSTHDKNQLVDELFQVHNQIFDGVDKAQFTNYVIDSKAQHTHIMIQRDQKNNHAAVGYCAFHFYKFDTLNEHLGVIRMEAGLLPEYRRGNNHIHLFAFMKAMQCMLSHPNRKIYFLGSLVHPSSYVALTNVSKAVWPTVQRPDATEAVQSIVNKLSDLFGLTPVHADQPNVVNVGWKTREAQHAKQDWLATAKPSAHFYLQQNPDYDLGHGLVTIMPVNMRNMLEVTISLMHKKRQRAVQRFWSKRRLTWSNLQQRLAPDLHQHL